VHGEILHGHGYSNRLESGRLLLVDAGAEEPGGYACDITRTFPVNGKWTAVQRHLYDTVLRAQREAIAACVPGRRFREIHDLAARVICEGLVEAELLRGDPAGLAARYAHTLFFCHGLGHLIGLDVHDMEDFGDLAGYAAGRQRRPEFGNNFLRLDRDLQPGYCVTIEPGVYLVPAIWQRDDLVEPFADLVNRSAVDALLRDNFGGIRIEETVCVTDSGAPDVLSRALPNHPDTVAGLVGASTSDR
jgi:Xaa-Pro aminopeptidase